MYTQKTLEIFKNPKNAGGLQGSNAIGKVLSDCGDIVKLYLKINDNEYVEEARFKAFGGPGTIAATSLLTELVVNKSINDIISIKNKDIIDILGGFPLYKIKCSVLAEEAIASAIEDYVKRKEKQQKKVN